MADAVEEGEGLYRKVIRISALDSPNVRLALEEQRAGLPVSDRKVVSGVIDWYTYQNRLQTWDPIRRSIGLDGVFYEGAEVRLFPSEWLNRAESLADALRGKERRAEAMGIDPAEGGDSSVWTVVDRLGIIEQFSIRTPDTSVITSHTIRLIVKYRIPPEKVLFDTGGGGKQHCDRLNDLGYKTRSIGFGAAVTEEPTRGLTLLEDKREQIEERYLYKNKRAEMYGLASMQFDPEHNRTGFAVPRELVELRRQLSPLPKLYDEEGRMWLYPKHRKSGERDSGDKITLDKILGKSPDEADSFVLAIYAMLHLKKRHTATAYPGKE